ncbi:uncharacterized protein LOC112345063 [Selaginella moellendorffii]|uniref:uncharacterized protein LOC112345063 n=1 Tax=Selaginella moellendorffii TaxID=88036 RepID=UPI000D1C65A0|nr:uncharacterized protein LOC112345063 [Selaginella moellendorffii]|eukprot:XP_024526730.1 uncharacterized protein LOC112345063 [Selaginella moellendorffii]
MEPTAAQGTTLVDLLREAAAEVIDGDAKQERSVVRRTREAFTRRAPRFRLAARSASADIMRWMHRGGPWRAFLVSTLGIVVFVSLAALATFILFLVTATANAVAIGFLMSVTGIGAFVALFFMMLTAVYIGALVTAAVAISCIALSTIGAAILVTAWILFWWCLWQGAKKATDFVRGSLALTGSALSAVSAAGPTQVIAVEK